MWFEKPIAAKKTKDGVEVFIRNSHLQMVSPIGAPGNRVGYGRIRALRIQLSCQQSAVPRRHWREAAMTRFGWPQTSGSKRAPHLPGPWIVAGELAGAGAQLWS